MPSPLTALDLITDSFLDAAIVSAGEPLSAEDAAFGLSKLSRLLDSWSSDELYIYAMDFLEYTLIPNVQPLLIGQAAQITSAKAVSDLITFTAKNSYKIGDYVDTVLNINPLFNVTGSLVTLASASSFNVLVPGTGTIAPQVQVGALAVYTGTTPPNFATLTQRPTRIENANIILNNVNPIVKVPLRVHNNKPGADWWSGVTVPTVPSTIPTDLYYAPQWPNGQLYLWCMQSQAYGLELEVWVNLADIATLNYPFYLPQGYRDAVTWSLAEDLCPSYLKPIGPDLARKAMMARAKITGLNSQPLALRTKDAGIPNRTLKGSMFNWENGSVVPGR